MLGTNGTQLEGCESGGGGQGRDASIAARSGAGGGGGEAPTRTGRRLMAMQQQQGPGWMVLGMRRMNRTMSCCLGVCAGAQVLEAMVARGTVIGAPRA